MDQPKGFTILEVLIVVAILGILSAIAIPALTKYVTEARRADGKTALLTAANASCFTIQTVGQGKQAVDTPCLTMTINVFGQKIPSACW